MNKIFSILKGDVAIDLEQDDISKSILYLSLPIVVINLLRMAYNFADTFWLSKLSKDALAAVTFSFPVSFLMISVGIGVSIAGSILVAKFKGEKNRIMVDYTASQTLTFSMLVSFLMGVVAYFNIEKILSILGASDKVLNIASGYLRIISIGIFFIFGFSVFISLMRGFGDTITPMLVMLVSVVLNITLDPFLIFGIGPFPKMGVEGAAYATILCRGVAFMIGLLILFSGNKGIQIRAKYLVPDPGFFKKLVKVGLPSSIEVTAESLSVNAMVAIIGQFSTAVVAGYGIGSRIYSFVFLPAMAASRGISTMTSQNIGARRTDRALKANYLSAKFLFLLLTVLGVFVFFGSEFLISLFSSDAEVIRTGSQFLRFVAGTFGFVGVWVSFNGGFRGSGKTSVAAGITILAMAIVRVPVSYFASGYMGVTGIWVGFIVSNLVGGMAAYFLFRKKGLNYFY